jgi:AcrR family transcriptional regulator
MARKLPFYLRPEDPPAKQRILRAALLLFAERGLEGTRIRDIADAAGCTNPALYKHFASKEELAAFLFETCYERLWTSMHEALGSAEGFDAKLDAYVGAYLALIDECPEAVLFLNDHLRALWPTVGPGLRPRTIPAQARGLLAVAEREGRRLDAPKLLVVALVGTLAQFARMVHFSELPRPASRHRADLVAILQRLVAGPVGR